MLMEEEEDDNQNENEPMAVGTPSLLSTHGTPDDSDQKTEPMQLDTIAEPAGSPVQVNGSIEKLLTACLQLIGSTKESQANKDADNWAIKHGCAFYMSNRFHCYYKQGQGCKASFETNNQLADHLISVHHVSQETIARSVQQIAQDKKLAQWVIAAKLPIHIVVDGQFNLFLSTLYGDNKEGYSVSQSRLEKVIKTEHDIISSELSQRLKTMDHLSVVVNQWERPEHPSILLFSVFFMDQEWNKKSFVIAAEPLESHDSRSAVFRKMGIVFMDLDIIDRIYSITCQGIRHLNTATLFTFMQKINGARRMKLTQDRIYTIMLDQMVMEMRIELLSSLRFDCEPLKVVINEMQNCKCNIFFKETQPYTIKLMQAYLDNKKNHHMGCRMKLCGICEADDECMVQIIKMDHELAFIYDWLFEAAEKNTTIANKAYVICCELGKSIKALAELRSSRRLVPKTTTSKNYEIAEAVEKADYMKKPLESMHKLLRAYRTQIENGRGHVEAFMYDSYAYNDGYFRSQRKTPPLLKQLKDISLLLEDIAEQESKRYRVNDITELLKINTEEKQHYEDPDVATSSSCNIINTKRRQGNKSKVIQKPPLAQPFSEQIQLLQQKQIAYFKKYPDTKIRDQPQIMTILSEQAVGGQINFWRQESDERLSVLMEHTKKAFAIPTTTQECINSVDQFKQVYLQLANQEQDANVDFTCKRALLSCWSQDFTLFKD
ncbi:hypothetical protein FB192DRAFT_1375727 [Mucor lusitanicus]|uniref:Uncharacterized protein n=1 Tax=Mucor circinelloides f. lusitanicus TaxID=29924 RepID=A0A8H4F0Z0_MUCCL|nr:hypothetical protein FB192DRAFT_1375727 [Mucor lusitanicus]